MVSSHLMDNDIVLLPEFFFLTYAVLCQYSYDYDQHHNGYR